MRHSCVSYVLPCACHSRGCPTHATHGVFHGQGTARRCGLMRALGSAQHSTRRSCTSCWYDTCVCACACACAPTIDACSDMHMHGHIDQLRLVQHVDVDMHEPRACACGPFVRMHVPRRSRTGSSPLSREGARPRRSTRTRLLGLGQSHGSLSCFVHCSSESHAARVARCRWLTATTTRQCSHVSTCTTKEREKKN